MPPAAMSFADQLLLRQQPFIEAAGARSSVPVYATHVLFSVPTFSGNWYLCRRGRITAVKRVLGVLVLGHQHRPPDLMTGRHMSLLLRDAAQGVERQ